MVKNLPAMQETWVQSLGWEDPLEEGMTTNSSILAWILVQTRGCRCLYRAEQGRLLAVGEVSVLHLIVHMQLPRWWYLHSYFQESC